MYTYLQNYYVEYVNFQGTSKTGFSLSWIKDFDWIRKYYECMWIDNYFSKNFPPFCIKPYLLLQ